MRIGTSKLPKDSSLICLYDARAYTALVDYWETILMIIGANIEVGKEYELRMVMFNLVEHFLL